MKSTFNNEVISWDRKHYEYPDNPKNIQITQFHNPIIPDGEVSCFRNDGSQFTVSLTQVHIEEDAGKNIHSEITNESFVDFNPFQLVIKELRIQGSFLNPLTQRRAANLIDSKKLKLDPLISRVLTLDEVPEILNKPPADGDIKYIIKP